MKKLSEINEAKIGDIQFRGSIGILNNDELEKYLNKVEKHISVYTRNVINYLIENGYDLLNKDNDNIKNPLLYFYNNGGSTNKSLYDDLKELDNIGRLKEVPVFMTRDEFNNIINDNIALDMVVLDLSDQNVRNKIGKTYTPLVHKIAKQWYGKINYDYDELISIGYEGLTYAMNTYGKRSKRSKADDEAIKKYSFMQYAAYSIRNSILWSMEESHTVRMTKSDMKKEKEEKGYNSKSHTISGDKTVSKNGDEGSKTVFDFIDSSEDADKNMDMQDIQKLWKEIYDILDKNFSKETMDIWYSFNGLNGHEKIKNKDLCKKYNMIASNITYYIYKVNNFIKKNLMNKMIDIYDLTKECLNDWDRFDVNMDDPKHLSINENRYY